MNTLDKIIGFFNPKAAFEREIYRKKSEIISNKRGYDGATVGRRGDNWTSPANGNNQNNDIQKSLGKLRERSIDGFKNNSTVFKAIRVIKNNVIGSGIMPTPIAAPLEADLSEAIIKKIKKHWDWFVKHCDFEGYGNFYSLQSLAMQTIAMQGEIFVVRHRDASSVVPFKIQLMSPHMCDHKKSAYLLTERPNNYIVQGVEFDSKGRRVGYWLDEYNPNNEFVMRVAPKFVPAEDVIQVFYRDFPEQVRGVPFGTPAMLNMRDLADYEDAQLMLQKVAACHAAFTTVPEDADGNSNDVTDISDHLEPGMIQRLAPGEQVTFNNPPTPQSYSEYVSKNNQKNAAGYGITYEQITGDMGNVNFSSGRMGWIEAQRQIEDWQYNMFIPQFCDGIWNWFIDALIIKGIIAKPAAAEWTPPAREMIDPVKEMNGMILELKSGLVSWTEACKRRGYNPDVLLDQIKKDRKAFEDAGIDVEWILKEVPEVAVFQE